MYVIAGLGNPGREYEGARHNVGFMTLDALADMENTEQIQIVGFDSGEEQQKAIQEGREYGTVTQNPYGLGYAAIVAAVRAIQGLSVDQKIDTGYQWLDKDTIDLETNQKYLYN